MGRNILRLVSSANVLTRNPNKLEGKDLGCDVTPFKWDPMSEPAPIDAFKDCTAVIHLLGESVQGRWNDDKKRRIRESRVIGTRNLLSGWKTAIDRELTAPKSFVAASAVGFYGSRGNERLTESSDCGSGFLSEVCIDWENALSKANDIGVSTSIIRVGIVLGKEDGMMKKVLLPFKLGLGGRLGSGKQWLPWVHITDLARLFLQQIGKQGTYNGSAPNPVTNLEFTKTLGKVLGRPTILPAPRFALRLALGEFADTILASQKVIPEATVESGFEFEFDNLEDAIRDIV